MEAVEYTYPMHPEIVRQEPGFCPICGMALEPRTVTVEDETNPELRDMTRRFWVSLGLSLPLLIMAMAEMLLGEQVSHAFSGRLFSPIMASAAMTFSSVSVMANALRLRRLTR